MTFVSEFEPVELWKHFDEILAIPRGSKNEEAIRRYVVGVAERNGLAHEQDAAGNLVVRKPATEGGGSATILQCHLDMVNEKNADVQHDFTRDPIRPRREGEYLKASGTTLGSDNGIGVATALAVLESRSLRHGPLECLFTVDEESGLTGAADLSPGLLHGKRLINLDSEEEGALYVGCAGGQGVNIRLPLQSGKSPSGSVALKLKLRGLKGGHSGVDIHLQRANAIRLLARILYSVLRETAFELSSFQGGNMHNAIPREAFATVVLSPDQRKTFETSLRTAFQAAQAEFQHADPQITLDWEPASDVAPVWDSQSRDMALGLLLALPHGVQSMSCEIPGLVETSSNLATAGRQQDVLAVHVSNRSSVDSALQAIQERAEAIGRLAGAEVEWTGGYPGWQPDWDSELLRVTRQVHEKLFGEKPEIKAIHAGLECGIIRMKYPRMDMISFGPQIESPHSPDERVHIASVQRFYELLKGVLGELVDEA